MKSYPTLPTIHMNGTSPEALRDDYAEAAEAVRDALRRVQKIEFNGRDYYPVEGSFQKAQGEHVARLKLLQIIADELMEIAVHCDEAATKRRT